MKNKNMTTFLLCFFIGVVFLFFLPVFTKGLLPIPSDTIIGLYYPYRDLLAKEYPNGIPFKNFLITDPVRQQYPWRQLVISAEEKLELPLWNPYNFAGTPLLANFQSAAFYPFNFLLFLMPFAVGWSLIIFLGPLLGGIFLFLYLNNLKLNKCASVLGAITFSFSGFFMSWLEWGVITHAGLWLPLILLSIDKLINKRGIKWTLIFIFSLISSFFAGHLQVFFYLYIFSLIYFLIRWTQFRKNKGIFFLFILYNLLFLIITSIQWIPTFQFIFLSGRDLDVLGIINPGWFVPWQNMIQFIAPDYFGNPATLNSWGVWGYGEFVGYVGIVPLILALFAMFYRRDKKTLFFGTILFLSMFFAFPTFIAKIPYLLKIPFLSTSQPTRLLYMADFALAVLSALGLDFLLKTKNKIGIIYSLIFISVILVGFWLFIPKEHFLVIRNNLILPTFLLAFSFILFSVLIVFRNKPKISMVIGIAILIIVAFDLLRFGWKFNSFTKKVYLFPSTQAISFLQKQTGQFRIMTTDSSIFPPNFSAIYKIQSVDGYDPLYLLRYGELIAASERGKPDINPPFGFNRIITPHNYDSKIIDLLGVKYILSLSDIKSSKLVKVFQEGQTRVYNNLNVLPRAFFVEILNRIKGEDKEKVIESMYADDFDLKRSAIAEGFPEIELLGIIAPKLTIGEEKISVYSENKVIIKTQNNGDGFLVLTDTYYPTWHAKIDGVETKIYRTDYNFRGIFVPKGKHSIEFFITLL